jgi:hypothetical protein
MPKIKRTYQVEEPLIVCRHCGQQYVLTGITKNEDSEEHICWQQVNCNFCPYCGKEEPDATTRCENNARKKEKIDEKTN